jgi:hypothetical protein
MPAPQRRRHGRPDADALAGLDDTSSAPDGAGEAEPAAPRLSKAAADDLVLGTPARGRAATTAPRARTASGGAGAKARVGFYQLTEDTARARAAYKWTGHQEGHRSLSDFFAAAIMKEVERLERDYNGGQPYAGIEPGDIPTGKPLRE